MLVTFAAPKLPELAEGLEATVQDMRDWRPAWRLMLPAMIAGLQRNIRSSGHAPLSAAYARRKARRGKGKAAFRYTGALLGELGSSAIAAAKIRARSVGWGPSRRYAYVLHHGIPTIDSSATSKQRSRRNRRRSQALAGKLPARPWLHWTEKMEAEALEIAHAHLEGVLARGASRGK